MGVVPVGVEIKSTITAKADLNLKAAAEWRVGFRQKADLGIAGRYGRTAEPAAVWERWFKLEPFDAVPPTFTVDGEFSSTVSLVPQIQAMVYGAAGIYFNTDPRLTLSGSATAVNYELTEAEWLLGAYADINAGLTVIGLEDDTLPSLSPFRLFTQEWGGKYSLSDIPLSIIRDPVSQNAKLGDMVVFSVDTVGGVNPSYQWCFNGIPIPGQTAKQLILNKVCDQHDGEYHVRITSAGHSTNSASAALGIIADGSTGPAPAGMVRIPAGTFKMGDFFNEGELNELPVHDVTISRAYFCDKYEVTKGLWDSIRAWGATWGDYTDLPDGSGNGNNHPVTLISWYDAVKWCNARSEKEGLNPCYTAYGTSTVFRTGSATVTCNFDRNGYRLPTEAEWERAARGGLNGRRFPNGNTISHSQACYYVVTNHWNGANSYPYDVSPSGGNHPSAVGSEPPTLPVGLLAPNRYGLYDMAGNVREMCTDKCSRNSRYPYTVVPVVDPRSSGTEPAVRGGYYFAYDCRVSCREWTPYARYGYSNIGFRCIRRAE